MSLIPVAQAAVADPGLRAVRFAMKDGSKKVIVLVSNPALENIELSSIDREAFDTCLLYTSPSPRDS